jgi:signal transduction histidine kinase
MAWMDFRRMAPVAGGSLTFETEPGGGTTFHIRLPVGVGEPAEVAA